jgi:hypothetical protein
MNDRQELLFDLQARINDTWYICHRKPCFIGEDGTLVDFRFLDKSKSKSVLNWLERIEQLKEELKRMEEFKKKLFRGEIDLPGFE